MGFRPRTTGVSVAVILAMGVPLASASAAGAAPEYKSATVLTTYNTFLKANAKKTFTLTATDADTTSELTFDVTKQPAHGQLAFTQGNTDGKAPATDTGVLTFTPTDANSMATYSDTATVTISDGTNTTTQDIIIAVKDNKVPTGTAITDATTGVNTPVDITLNGRDDLTSAGNLTYTLSGDPVGGSVTIAGNKATFTPATDSSLAGSFKYTVSDDMGGISDPISVSVAVTKGSKVTLTGTQGATVGDRQILVADVAAVPADTAANLTGAVKFFAQTGSEATKDLKETELGTGTRGTGTDANKWTLETTKLPAGTVTVVARYDGDSNYAKSEVKSAEVNIAKATATTKVTAPASARVGDPMDVTATVTASEGAPAPSNGKVQFFWQVGSATAVELSSPISSTDGTYKATVAAPSADPAGKVIARFTGDTNLTAVDASATVNAARGTSSVKVSLDKATAGLGAEVKVTATVTPDKYVDGTGKVEFWDNGNVVQENVSLNPKNADGTFTATFPYTPKTPGEHKITAFYSGDGNLNRTLDSVGATLTVTAAPSTVDKPTAVGGSTVGAKVTLGTTVKTTGTPTGKVQFYVANGSGSPVAAGSPVDVKSDQTASVDYDLNAAGNLVFTAKYLGDANVTASEVSPASDSLTVAKSAPSLGPITLRDAKGALTSPVAAGTEITFVAPLQAAGVSSSDSVYFFDGDPANLQTAKMLGAAPVSIDKDGVATASLKYAFDKVATGHQIYAAFPGNANQSPAKSGPVSLDISKAAPVVALIANPGGVGKPVELTASLNTKGASAEGAKVQFSDAASGLKIGEPVAVVNGKATISTANITNAGTYQYKAELAPTANMEAASDTQSVKVAAAASSQKLEAKTGADGKVTLTSTVSGPEGVSTDGKVTFYDGDKELGVADVSKGVATLTGLDMSVGTHLLTATYASSGDLSNSVVWGKAVVKANPTVELTAPEKATEGEKVSFAIKVSADAAAAPFSGTVNLMEGDKVVGTGTVGAGGSGIATATFASTGEHTIVAAFEGSETLNTADSAAVKVNVVTMPRVELSAPIITGTAVVGKRLTASAASATTGAARTYQWLRGGVAISGATYSGYTLTAADYGKQVSVRVTASAAGYKSATATSAAKTVGAGTIAVTKAPTLAGTAKVASTLKVNAGTWAPRPTFTYTWLRDGKVIKSGMTSYKLTTTDRGHRISVRVIGKAAGYKTVTKVTNSIGTVK